MTYTIANPFAPYSPFTVGFDHALRRLEQLGKQEKVPSYPPYNIIQVNHDEDRYIIELAVAGFLENELDIQLKEGVLTVKTKDKETGNGSVLPIYLHQGIAKRAFTRTFTLADTIEVEEAVYGLDGILRISLVNVIPEDKRARNIEIVRKHPSSVEPPEWEDK